MKKDTNASILVDDPNLDSFCERNYLLKTMEVSVSQFAKKKSKNTAKNDYENQHK